MIEMIEIPTRVTTTNGPELDAVEHARDLVWGAGERKAIKRGMNRRHRRQSRQALRLALS